METELSKGGEKFGYISVKRMSKGVEVWARLDPKVEELIQSAAEGNGTYTTPLESYGRSWVGMEPTPIIKVYNLEKPLDGPTYTLGGACGLLKDSKGKTNLSFLTFQGVGTEKGVRFLIQGPIQAELVIEYGKSVIRNVQYFLREYLVPVNIGLNITVSNQF